MFLYYLPGVTREQVTREYLAASPLKLIFWDLLKSAALFDRRVRAFAIHANGPDKSSGCIVAAMPAAGLEGPPPAMRDGQTWTAIGDPVQYWLGYDELPDPDSLKREHIVAGVEAELGDGRVWECPIVRRKGINALPSRWGRDPRTGTFRAMMLAEYSASWEASERILRTQISGEITTIEAMELCEQMLAINYRVGPHEVSALGLLDDTTFGHVWRAATDAEFLEEWIASLDGDGHSKKD